MYPQPDAKQEHVPYPPAHKVIFIYAGNNMDTDFYSDQAIEDFVKKTLCQGDAKLFLHYINGHASKFRERLSRKFGPEKQKNIEQALYASVTDTIRDIILDTIGSLTESLRPAGDLIVSGGEAFNMYFNREQRIITSDIDTKFVPAQKGFVNLQAIKLQIWSLMGQHAKRLDRKIKARIQRVLGTSKIGQLLGISVPKTGPWVTRRYTLIPKKRQKITTSEVTRDDVLIDVELFALDLKINYYSIERKRIVPMRMGGILDIALMRPGEMGYEVALGRNQGAMYLNKTTGKPVVDRRILFASKRFLIEDLYLMQKLGLRPKKVDKDRKRMFQFAQDILGVKKITARDSIISIFKKSEKLLGPLKRKMPPRKKFILRAINPALYTRWTTKPSPDKTYQLVGFKGTVGVKVPGYKSTSGPFKFNLNSKKWTLNESRDYIKNEMTHRPVNITRLPKNVRAFDTLYGYRANRNGPETKILLNAARIPLIGLKRTSI